MVLQKGRYNLIQGVAYASKALKILAELRIQSGCNRRFNSLHIGV